MFSMGFPAYSGKISGLLLFLPLIAEREKKAKTSIRTISSSLKFPIYCCWLISIKVNLLNRQDTVLTIVT